MRTRQLIKMERPSLSFVKNNSPADHDAMRLRISTRLPHGQINVEQISIVRSPILYFGYTLPCK
jgi:hypothetical protein